ncbi:MAG: 3-dehydroquinate synthase II [Candidatus Helarchaeota archaeon]
MKKIILKLLGNWNDIKEIASEAVIEGLNNFIVAPDNIDKIRNFGNVHIYSYSEQNNPDFLIKKITNTDKLGDIGHFKFGFEISVLDKKDENLVIKSSELRPKFIIIQAKDWVVIPLENLIANLHKKDVELYAEVNTIDEIKLSLEILELGTDGVVYTPKSAGELKEIKGFLAKELSLELTTAKIVEKKEVGSGDRVCIDTCSLLKFGEGMLVGSQSRGLFLIHAETIETEFVSSRPFRVNAGSVSSYILMPNGKTQYLSEIEAGTEVLIVGADGKCRTAVVGRSKIEKRPLMLIKAKINEDIIKTIVQNAETIRLVLKNGEPISVARIKEGDEVIVYYQKGGRHFGTLIDESIIEK